MLNLSGAGGASGARSFGCFCGRRRLAKGPFGFRVFAVRFFYRVKGFRV